MAGERILIVEDNAMNMELAADLLTLAGFVVLQASSGEEGISLAMREKPALILMDLDLPNVTGFEATARLKQLEATRGITVIALTAFAMDGDRERALSAGCRDVISKPIDTRLFSSQVSCFLTSTGSK